MYCQRSQENATNAGKSDTKQISVRTQRIAVKMKEIKVEAGDNSPESVTRADKLDTRQRNVGMTTRTRTYVQAGGSLAEIVKRDSAQPKGRTRRVQVKAMNMC